MTTNAILYPLLAQVGLTFVLMLAMASVRVKGARRRKYKLRDIAVNNSNYPDDIRKFGNSYANQFELPVLFYLLCVLLVIGGRGDDRLYVFLAWGFVAARLLHAYIHVTSNHVVRRFYAFLVGAVLLVTMWGLFALGQAGII